jgi:hypothetical protein
MKMSDENERAQVEKELNKLIEITVALENELDNMAIIENN